MAAGIFLRSELNSLWAQHYCSIRKMSWKAGQGICFSYVPLMSHFLPLYNNLSIFHRWHHFKFCYHVPVPANQWLNDLLKPNSNIHQQEKNKIKWQQFCYEIWNWDLAFNLSHVLSNEGNRISNQFCSQPPGGNWEILISLLGRSHVIQWMIENVLSWF